MEIDLMRANLASLQTNSNTQIMRAINIANYLQMGPVQKQGKSPIRFRNNQANSYAKTACHLKNLTVLNLGHDLHPTKNCLGFQRNSSENFQLSKKCHWKNKRLCVNNQMTTKSNPSPLTRILIVHQSPQAEQISAVAKRLCSWLTTWCSIWFLWSRS